MRIKTNLSITVSPLLFSLLFFSCSEYRIDCREDYGLLMTMTIEKSGNFSKFDLTDTTRYNSTSKKSKVGLKLPTLEINGNNFTMKENDLCEFESVKDIPQSQLAGYFSFGQVNNFKLSGEISGTVNESFQLPEELKVKSVSSNIIHRNSDFTVEVTGVGDFPLPVTANDDKDSDNFDFLHVNVAYSRQLSDTITYPNLPVEQKRVGSLPYDKTNIGKLVIPSSVLRLLPLNGTARLTVERRMRYRIPKTGQTEKVIHVFQTQFNDFVITD
jgi:hypothetical protein